MSHAHVSFNRKYLYVTISVMLKSKVNQHTLDRMSVHCAVVCL